MTVASLLRRCHATIHFRLQTSWVQFYHLCSTIPELCLDTVDTTCLFGLSNDDRDHLHASCQSCRNRTSDNKHYRNVVMNDL